MVTRSAADCEKSLSRWSYWNFRMPLTMGFTSTANVGIAAEASAATTWSETIISHYQVYQGLRGSFPGSAAGFSCTRSLYLPRNPEPSETADSP